MRTSLLLELKSSTEYATLLQEAGWTQYPTFEELHQILYRGELNIYENFNMPPGITSGDDGSHVNEKTMEMVKKLLDAPPRFIVEVRPFTLQSTAKLHPSEHTKRCKEVSFIFAAAQVKLLGSDLLRPCSQTYQLMHTFMSGSM